MMGNEPTVPNAAKDNNTAVTLQSPNRLAPTLAKMVINCGEAPATALLEGAVSYTHLTLPTKRIV